MANLYIKLDDTEYRLDTTNVDELPYWKYKKAELEKSDSNEFWRYWHMRSFHGGERQTRILRETDPENFAYHDGEGIDVSEWGEVTIQPALARGLAVQSATMPMTVSADGQTLVIGLTSSPYVKYTTDGSTFSSATGDVVTNAAAVTDLITAPTGTVYGVQNNKIIYSADNGASWTNDASSGVPTDMVALTYCAGQLYALGASYLKYWDGDSWETASSYGGTCCCTFQENVYFAKNDTLFKWTGQTCFQDDRLPAGFIITGLFSYRKIMWITGYFWVQGAKRGAAFYVIGGYEGHLFSIPHSSTADYGIRGIAGSDDEVYIANPKRGGVDRYDLTDSGLSSGPATGTAMYIPPKSVAYFDGYVAIGRYDNVAGTDGVYIANVANPTTYRSSAWFTTSEYDFGSPRALKVFKEITVVHKALAAGQSVKVEYSIDHGTTWELVGWSAHVATTEETFVLDNIKGRTFKLRVTLTAGTSQATTPTVTEIVVAAAPATQADWVWDVRLMLPRSRQGDTLIKQLEKSADDQKTMDFTDLREQEYKVVIDNIRYGQRAGDESSAIVYLVLYSV